MSVMNVAVNGHEIMEEVVLMATLLVSCVKNTTIAIATTHAKHVTCAMSLHVKEQTALKRNVITPDLWGKCDECCTCASE